MYSSDHAHSASGQRRAGRCITSLSSGGKGVGSGVVVVAMSCRLLVEVAPVRRSELEDRQEVAPVSVPKSVA